MIIFNSENSTVKPLYYGIRYYSKIRYNVNSIYTKSAARVFFSLTVPSYSLGNIRFGYLLESPRRGDSNKYTKRMIYKRTVQKYPLIML